MEFLECYETTAHPNLVALVRDEIATLVSRSFAQHLLRMFLAREVFFLQGFPDVNVFFSPSGVQFMDQILRAESIAFKQTKVIYS